MYIYLTFYKCHIFSKKKQSINFETFFFLKIINNIYFLYEYFLIYVCVCVLFSTKYIIYICLIQKIKSVLLVYLLFHIFCCCCCWTYIFSGKRGAVCFTNLEVLFTGLHIICSASFVMFFFFIKTLSVIRLYFQVLRLRFWKPNVFLLGNVMKYAHNSCYTILEFYPYKIKIEKINCIN